MKHPAAARREACSERPAADDDLLEIVSFLLGGSDRAAVRFLDALDAAGARIARHPGIGRPRPDLPEPGVRSYLVAEHWVVFYVETANVVEVRRIVNARRDLRALRLRD